ncbi:MAG: hypothetical protein J6B12_00250, partial [Clostridia bacterium]|nr:hypothetical protein [Clostridia bacterium]
VLNGIMLGLNREKKFRAVVLFLDRWLELRFGLGDNGRACGICSLDAVVDSSGSLTLHATVEVKSMAKARIRVNTLQQCFIMFSDLSSVSRKMERFNWMFFRPK